MSLDGVEILLLDDSSADVELTLHALQHKAMVDRIHVARDREEALNFLFCREPFRERAGEPLPRLILLDLKMPRVDGLSALRTLKVDPRTRAIPVIIHATSKEEKDVVKGYGLSVNRYIQKPVDFDQLRETVRTLGLYWLLVNQAPPRQTLDTFTEESG